MLVGLAAFPGRRGPTGKRPAAAREPHMEPWSRLLAAPLGAPRSILSPTLLSKGLWVPWIWLRWEEEDPTAALLWKRGQVLAQGLAQSSRVGISGSGCLGTLEGPGIWSKGGTSVGTHPEAEGWTG